MLAAEVIYSYTRSDAIRDGVLLEVPDDIVREAGIVYPVAVTDNLRGTHIPPSSDLSSIYVIVNYITKFHPI